MINGNISRTELRLNRRSLVIWILIVVAVIVVYLGSYTFFDDMDVVEILTGYPDMLISGMNMSPEMFENVNSYHAGMVMLFGLLLSAIYAMMLAGLMISRDADIGTVEFLYTRPVTRTVIMVSKVWSFLVLMIIFWVTTYLAAAGVGGFWVAPGHFDLLAQLYVHLSAFLACLAAGGVAFALAPLFNRVQGTTSLAIFAGFAFFFLNGLGAMFDRLDFLRYLSLFFYADLVAASTGSPYFSGMIVLGAVFVAGVLIGLVLLNRKDFIA